MSSAHTINITSYYIIKVLIICHFYDCINNTSEPGSSGSIVSDYGLDNRVIEVRSSEEAKGFFF
jgi:hypothetical protein